MGGVFFFSSRRRHTRYWRDWSSDVCSSDLWLETCLLGRNNYALKESISQEDLPHKAAVCKEQLSVVVDLYTDSKRSGPRLSMAPFPEQR